MRRAQSTIDDTVHEWTRGVLHAPGNFRFIFCLLRGGAFLAGAIVISVSVVGSEERLHPSLVDPAITKCSVCHTDLGASHGGGAAIEDCLSCHTIVNRSESTYLIVEGQPPAVMDVTQEPKGPETEGGSQRASEIPVAADIEAARSKAPRAETAAVIAGEHEKPSATDPPPEGTTERSGPVVESDVSASSDRIYEEGMRAFNRADFERAFDAWKSMLEGRSDHYALQVEVDSLFVSAQSTFARYGQHSLFIIVKDDLYWVYSGLFTTRERAIEALNLLPEPLRRGGAFPVAVSEILPRQ